MNVAQPTRCNRPVGLLVLAVVIELVNAGFLSATTTHELNKLLAVVVGIWALTLVGMRIRRRRS
ncbi:hypothetical protein ET495_12020 [Xylanimonas allomyrinae]|uniref:Uncharacterized protein n=1 Tax=Xylanimonas allomyrinae TaxID=2509459 RepID=A0A4P6ELY8_9MICO|nr:hypothetical protein [Xylanimonas allomyrinae]QAY63840.1 hypothetical protein ET495_12020 [Xylanimonas allomyrinae]